MSSNYVTFKKPSHIQRVKKALLHAFIPREHNQYHPHLIRPLGLLLLVVVAVLGFTLGSSTETGSVKGEASSFTREQLLDESNRLRQADNKDPLVISSQLNAAALLKAQDMINRQYWSHNAPDGTTPWYWLREVNYRYDYAGENLAKGFRSASGVVTAWMGSPEHRQNALSPDYQEVGFGVAEGELHGQRTYVVVALYGSQLGATGLSEAESEVLAATDGGVSLITRFGIGLQSLSPALLGSIGLIALAIIAALLTQLSLKKLPPELRKSWKRHHGMYKAIGMITFVVVLIMLYGTGQII